MKQRSASYPYYTILESLSFSEKIYKIYGNSYRATREEIAEALGFSVGSLAQKIGSAVQYGLLDLKVKAGYIVTDLFVEYHRPISEKEKEKSIIKVFKNPTLYIDLIEVFNGNILPPLKPLANILLQKHSISEKACDRAAEIFETNAIDAGILGSNRVLSFDSNSIEVVEEAEVIAEEVEEGLANQINQDDYIQRALINPADINKDKNSDNSKGFNEHNPIPHNIPLKNKLPAQLILPSDVSSSDFDFIISYIGLIRNQY